MTENIHTLPDFAGLLHFLSKLSERNKGSEILTRQQTLRLKSLINSIIVQIQKNINQKKSDKTENSSYTKADENLNFLLSAVLTLFKQNLNSELEDRITKLEEENKNLKNGLLDDQQDVIANAENALISRIVELLNTKITISNEDELADFIQKRTEKYQQLVSKLINTFGLPEETKGTDVVNAIQNKFGKKEKNSHEITNDDINAAYREELQKATNDLLSLQNEVENMKKTIENKNEHIRRLRDERDAAKKQAKNVAQKLPENDTIKKQGSVSSSIASIINNDNTSSNINIQAESYKAELYSIKIENEKKNRKIEKLKRYIQTIEDKIEEYQGHINILEDENNDMKEQIEALNSNIMNSTSDKSIPDNNEEAVLRMKLEKKNAELMKMQQVFDELALQLNTQNDELSEESGARFNLVSYIHRLLEVCQILESQLESSYQKNQEMANRLDQAQVQIQNYESQQIGSPYSVRQSLDLTFLRTVQRLLEETFPNKEKQISAIAADDAVSASQRVLQLFNFIIECYKQKSNNYLSNSETDSLPQSAPLNIYKEMANTFYSAAVSQLKFLDELVNSRDIQNWVIGDEKIEDTRARLQTQCIRMESFIADNCQGIARNPNLFDYLIIKSDPMTLSSHITEFLDQFQEPQTPEGKELFLMLIQALTANDILQKYANEARVNYEEQYNELRNLRNAYGASPDHISSSQNRSNPQNISDDYESSIRINELSNAIETVRNLIRNAIANGKSQDLIVLFKSLDKLDEVKFDPNKYVKKVERKLAHEITESQKTKIKLDNVASDATKELSLLKEEMKRLNDEFQQKTKEMDTKTEDMKNTIHEKDQTISKLKHELGLSNSQYDSLLRETKLQLASKAENTDINSSSKITEIQNEFNETRKQYDEIVKVLKNEVSEMQKRVEISQKETREKIANIKSSSKKKQMKLADACKALQAKLEKSESEHAIKVSSLNKKLEQAQNSEAAALKETQKLTEEITELKSRISSLSVEQKMMNARLQSKDEKMKREKALFESQLKLKVFAVESDSKTKLESLKNEMALKSQEFLSKICRMFREIVDINQPVDEETVEQVLNKVRTRLTTLDKESFAADEANHELSSIKQILGPTKFIKVSTAVNEIIEKNKQLEEELLKIETENKSIKKNVNDARVILAQNTNNKEWEDWAKKLYLLVSDGFSFAKSPKEIKNAIEEVVFAAVGNKIVWRRLDYLRAEKKLLIKGVQRVRSKPGPPSIRQLMTVIVVVERLQKLSGHYQSSLSIRKDFHQTPSSNIKHKSSTRNPRTPLFSKFVVQQSPGGFGTAED